MNRLAPLHVRENTNKEAKQKAKSVGVLAVSESDFLSSIVVDTSRPPPVNFPSAAMLSAGPVLAKRRRDGTTAANGGESFL